MSKKTKLFPKMKEKSTIYMRWGGILISCGKENVVKKKKYGRSS